MSEGLRIERRESAAIVVLDRPDRQNALSRDLVRALGRVGKELDADDSVRAVILTGAGQRAFCAGADLKERRGMSNAEVLDMLRLYRTELAWIGAFRAPVVAAINGIALGGGLELALACDLRIAVDGAVLGLPETTLGIIPGAGGTQRLPRIVGAARARELILLGRRWTAREAFSIGLVNHVVPDAERLLDDTLAFIRPILDGAPLAQRAALEALRASELPLEQGLEVELAAYERCLKSEDRLEGLRAFEEKRPPRFTGR
ncbi:MAG TPA: enoyl-CoA hydratase-related protein [Polyangiaceae bacterium]|nr:enoyl-CoA hydratase-related protein [Polyangiaceae bacterium]